MLLAAPGSAHRETALRLAALSIRGGQADPNIA
jgi:hypothetical protein